MAKAIETGLPKMRIEEAAARRQARIDSGRETIVGREQVPPASTSRRSTCSRSTTRPCARRSCGDWRRCARRRDREGGGRRRSPRSPAPPRRGDGNLLELSVTPRRGPEPRSGEISSALETVFGRYQAVNRTISGVYSSESQDDPVFSTRPRRRHRVRGRGGAPAAHPGREAGPGRPRPRARRSSPPRSPTWASTWTWARCSRRRARPRAWRSRTTCTCSASPAWRAATRRSCRRRSPSSKGSGATTSWWWSAA